MSTDEKTKRRGHNSGGREVPEHLRQIPKPARLREDVCRPELACAVGRCTLGVSREDNHGQVREAASDAGENGESVESGHDQIKENPVEGRRFDDLHSFGSIEGHEDIVTLEAERLREHLSYRRIVVDYQYSHGRLRGDSIRAGGFARQELTFETAHGDC